jgi:hypothetical protein
VTRASFKKYVAKAAERVAKDPSSHDVSTSCMCLPCMLARYKVLTNSLEERLYEAVEKRVGQKRGES